MPFVRLGGSNLYWGLGLALAPCSQGKYTRVGLIGLARAGMAPSTGSSAGILVRSSSSPFTSPVRDLIRRSCSAQRYFLVASIYLTVFKPHASSVAPTKLNSEDWTQIVERQLLRAQDQGLNGV